MVDTFDQNFWNSRWENGETGWDLGAASSALMDYFKQVDDKNAKILIPGCGNAHETEQLVAEGFTNITLIDIAPKAVEILKEKFKNQPEITVICEDFFQHVGKYDFIVEQTFFCALDHNLRVKYVSKMYDLLSEKGKLVGVLFNKDFGNPFPPFGGSISEYEQLFKHQFKIRKLELCYNSSEPRKDTEVFINFEKK
mgnify:CR=1 FL=1